VCILRFENNLFERKNHSQDNYARKIAFFKNKNCFLAQKLHISTHGKALK
jgi:hypothetical protein